MKRLIPFVLGASLLFVGCAGAGMSGAMIGALLLVATLVLAACEGDDPAEQADGRVITTAADADASATTPDTVADAIEDQSDIADDGCSGVWETGCQNGQSVPMCCPAGMACNYGWSVPCNGTCINAYETCPSPDAVDETTETVSDTDDADVTCDGTWESACVDGLVTPMCCPAGLACNYGELLVHCGDGTCVLSPETCPQ